MSELETENVDEAVTECRNCGESVLSVYIEDGLCHECRGNEKSPVES